MTKITPFRAVRPARDKAHLVASRSYVTYEPRKLKRKLSENPFTFIHIINPEFGEIPKTAPNSPERFALIREKYRSFVQEGILQKDPAKAFYIYRQITPEKSFTGIVCGVDVSEYNTGHIKVHEHTLDHRVDTFTNYLDICGFNAEPVLLTYRKESLDVSDIIGNHTRQRPEYDFTTTDRMRHQLWLMDNPADIEKLKTAFEALDCLYIADGHHRMASSANLGNRRETEPGKTTPANFALAYLIPDTTLGIQAFHRVIAMEEPLVESEFMAEIKSAFHVSPCAGCYLPESSGEFGMFLPSGWYKLTLKSEVESDKVSDHLDAVILTKNILEPVLDIQNQKTDSRVSFIHGNEKIPSIEKRISRGEKTVLFTLHPVSNEAFFEVSDAGEIMPPKSTYIEPKLRSGLTIMELN